MDPISKLVDGWREEPYGGGHRCAHELERALPDIIHWCMQKAKEKIIESFDWKDLPSPVQWGGPLRPQQFPKGEFKELILSRVTTIQDFRMIDNQLVQIIKEDDRNRALHQAMKDLIDQGWVDVSFKQRGNSFCTQVKLLAGKVTKL